MRTTIVIITSLVLALGAYATFAQGPWDQPTEVARAELPTVMTVAQGGGAGGGTGGNGAAGGAAGGETSGLSGQPGPAPGGPRQQMPGGTGTFGRDGSSRTFERERGMDVPSARDRFRSEEFGRGFPERQLGEPFRGPEEAFPQDRFGFDDRPGDKFYGPEEVFPRDRFDDDFRTRPFERDFQRDQFGFDDDFRTRPFERDFRRDQFGFEDDFRTRPFDRDSRRDQLGFEDDFRTRPFDRDFRRDRFDDDFRTRPFDQDRSQDDVDDQQFDDEFRRDQDDWREDIWTERFSNEGFRRDPFGLREDFGPPAWERDGVELASLTSVGEPVEEILATDSGDDTEPGVIGEDGTIQ